VVTGEQHVRNLPAAVLGRARVVGILRRTVERGTERLLAHRLLVPERPRELAQHRVAEHEGRELSPGEHVSADRNLLGGEVLEHALVEPLIAARQQCQCPLPSELVDQSIVEQPAARGQRDHPPLASELERIAGIPGS